MTPFTDTIYPQTCYKVSIGVVAAIFKGCGFYHLVLFDNLDKGHNELEAIIREKMSNDQDFAAFFREYCLNLLRSHPVRCNFKWDKLSRAFVPTMDMNGSVDQDFERIFSWISRQSNQTVLLRAWEVVIPDCIVVGTFVSYLRPF
jgi:hypothetical protein